MHRGKGKLSGVLSKGFKPDKCKTSLRMAVARIKLLRNRKEAQVRQMRREVAQLLAASNQDQTALIRVEHVIREEKCMQAYDLVEVYCELIVARLSIIDSQKACPIDLKEAIASVIFASMRCADVTELADVRKQFTSKYGKEFCAAALEVRPDSGVNRLVIEKLSAGAPDVQTKIKTLTSIAEEHNIQWEPKAFEEKLRKPNEDLLHGSATYYGGNVSTMGSSTPTMPTQGPTYSGVSASTMDSATSRVPTGPYSPAEVSANNAYPQDNRRVSNASVPPSSQHGASAYSSTQMPGSNNFSHGNPGGPSVSRPYSQYDASVPDTVSRNEEVNQPRERKPSVTGANWNVEFKDAASAAQAAAESAEMASLAARAAAQLASHGNYSGEQNTGGFERAAYNHENAPRKQPSEHSMKDEKRSFSDQRLRINDPNMISSNERKHSGGGETNHTDSQNTSTDSTAYTPVQDTHFYSSENHAHVYGMPTEPPRAHSPERPHFDDLYERESNTGRSQVHPFDFPGEKLQDTALGGHNVNDAEIREASSDKESTDDYYGNYSSSHGTFTHGSSAVGDNQNEKTQKNSSSIVFDQYESDVEEENVFDTFSSKYAEQQPGVQEHMGFSTADWSQQHRNESPTLFSRTESQPSDNLEENRKEIPSPHSYVNLPPTFDSDGSSSDEEITTTMYADPLRSQSRGSACSGFNNEANRISGEHGPDDNESIEGYESRSRKKLGASPGLNVSHKEQHGSGPGGSPRFDFSGAQTQRNLNRVQSRDSDLSDEETTADKYKGTSSAGANENQSLPFTVQTSATSDDKEKDDLGLNFGRLTPGLRNKPRQPPPYTKNSRENIVTKPSLNKASFSAEETVDSEEKQTRNIPKSSPLTRASLGGSYSSELYDRNQSVGTHREARSTVADDTEKLSEQFDNTSHGTTKSSECVNSSQELYREKTGTAARQDMRSRMARYYFDSDGSEEELETQAPQSKGSREKVQSRRTQELTSDTKRDGRVRTGAQYGHATESTPKETKVTQAFPNLSTEQRRDAPVYSRGPVQRSSPRTEHVESTITRGKSQDAELNRSSVPENEGSTETSTGTPKGSTLKSPPAHVHPKLPTDYDSFAAHFMSLRTNRR